MRDVPPSLRSSWMRKRPSSTRPGSGGRSLWMSDFITMAGAGIVFSSVTIVAPPVEIPSRGGLPAAGMEPLVEARVVVLQARLVAPDLRSQPVCDPVERFGPVFRVSPGGERRGRDGEHRLRLPAGLHSPNDEAQMAELWTERRKQPIEARLFVSPVRADLLLEPRGALEKHQVVEHGFSFQGVAGPPVPPESFATLRLRRTIRTFEGLST